MVVSCFIFHGSWFLDVYIMVAFTLEISFTLVLIKTSRIHWCEAPASWVNEWKWWATRRCEFCTPEIAVASWNWEPGWGGRAGNARRHLNESHGCSLFLGGKSKGPFQHKKHLNFSWWSSSFVYCNWIVLGVVSCHTADYITWLFSDISMTHPTAAWGEAKNRPCFINSGDSG